MIYFTSYFRNFGRTGRKLLQCGRFRYRKMY